jgi:hypothetical protein
MTGVGYRSSYLSKVNIPIGQISGFNFSRMADFRYAEFCRELGAVCLRLDHAGL